MSLISKAKKAMEIAALVKAGIKPSGKTWHCCGYPIEVDHLRKGCEGEAHEGYGGATHSGEVFMTKTEYKDYLNMGGKVKSARRADGGYHVKQK